MRSSKLFHTVVVYGAALGGCHKESVVDAPMAPSDSSSDASREVPPSMPAPPPPTVGTISARPGPAPSGSARPCPPGSELPYPPCYYIR